MASNKRGKDRGDFVLEKLAQIQNPENMVPFEEGELATFFSDVSETAEAVSDERKENVDDGGNDSTATGRVAEKIINRQKPVEEQSAKVKANALDEYFEKVKSRPEVVSRSSMNIDSDIIDFLKPLRSSNGIPLSHLIECIVSDWIELHYDGLETYRLIERKNKFLK